MLHHVGVAQDYCKKDTSLTVGRDRDTVDISFDQNWKLLCLTGELFVIIGDS